MKLSLAWIFDHIDADWRSIAISDLTQHFKNTIAELDGIEQVRFDAASYSAARVTEHTDQAVTVWSQEWQREYTLPVRQGIRKNQWYLIQQEAGTVQWATLASCGSSKDGLFPAVMLDEQTANGSWKQQIPAQDYILEVDNKSISNRPDLWGHRGMAREIAAVLRLPFKDEYQFIADLEVRTFEGSAPGIAQSPLGITLKDKHACKRFTGFYLDNVVAQASDCAMAFRLARVDARPLSLLVDVTNYVMFDLGQPMHAYDAATIPGSSITPQFAQQGQALQLLDGQTIKLSKDDLVITDGEQPLALAGIMGGTPTAITDTTMRVFIESACFDPATVRRAATRHKLRTEASVRFEKSLDPNQTTVAIARMIKLLRDASVVMKEAPYIASLGNDAPLIMLSVEHAFIEQRLGVTVSVQDVKSILECLGFGVAFKDGNYEVAVPSFRATKDVTIAQDIVEEVGRFIGYQAITPVLPLRATQPYDMHELNQLRRMRSHCAYALRMRELYNYAFFDEQFLRELSWQPTNTVDVANPLSEQWRRLVTSLIPHLVRAIAQNSVDHEMLSFFELAKTWTYEGAINERQELAGIMFDKKQPVDFYATKQELTTLLTVLGVRDCVWRRVDAPEQAWYMPYQTADIVYAGKVLGRAGKINPLFLHTLVEGDAFIFELDAAALKTYRAAIRRYKPASKYPDVVRDISVFVNVEHAADELKQRIKNAHPAITHVDLVDFFHKAEWVDRKSLTFRYVMCDDTKTLTKQEADAIGALVTQVLGTLGAEVR